VTWRDLPSLNAALNSASAALLLAGWWLIRHARRRAHRRAMLAALATSALFLASYLAYHFEVGSVRFTGRGATRSLYLAILLSHTILAAVIVPLVGVTVARALRGRFEAHRALARYTLPLWLWVSVSGVVVYWMLYRLPRG
jgi:putative membrane protein